MHDLLARQMPRQRATERLPPLRGNRRQLRFRSLRRAVRFLDILQQQLQLRQRRLELLRGAAELHPPQASDLCLQLLDLHPGRNNHALQQRNIVGQ